MRSLYCCNRNPGCSFRSSGNLRSSKAAKAAFCLRSGCLSIPATAFLSSPSPPCVKLNASSASSIFDAANAGPTSFLGANRSSKFPARLTAFLSSPRTLAAGLEGREARSASSRALSSAFLARRAAFLASSTSALEGPFAPLDHFWDSSRSSVSCCFAIRASLAAAFYHRVGETDVGV